MNSDVYNKSIYSNQDCLKDQKIQFQIKRIIDENKVMGRDSFEGIIKAQLINNNQIVKPETQSGLIKKLLIDENFQIDFKYKDLDYNSSIAITLWSTRRDFNNQIPSASTIISLFDENLQLRQGNFHLLLWPDKQIDPEFQLDCPGLVSDPNIQILNQSCQQLELLKEKQRRENDNDNDNKILENLTNKIYYTYQKISAAFIEIEFPKWNYRIFYDDIEVQRCFYQDKIPTFEYYDVIQFADIDHEFLRVDPIQDILNQIQRDIDNPKDLKPSKEEIIKIENFLKRPNLHKDLQNQNLLNLLWKYRYWLKDDKDALVKFLSAVNFNLPEEEEEALQLLERWKKIDYDDALFLLSSNFCSNTLYGNTQKGKSLEIPYQKIREYAISILKQSSKQEISLILLQLVQALRYEEFKTDDNGKLHSLLSKFLINVVKNDIELSTNFYWYVTVECDEDQSKMKNQNKERQKQIIKIYQNVLKNFVETLNSENIQILQQIQKQISLKDQLTEISLGMKKKNGQEQKKEFLRSQLRLPLFHQDVFQKHFFCLNPAYEVFAVQPEKCTCFKSAMAPMLIFLDAKYQNQDVQYPVIFKNGDDLRQDQLVIQMFKLFDQLLKNVNINLEIIPYSILACSKNNGFLEFVPDSKTVQDIQDVAKYLRDLSIYSVSISSEKLLAQSEILPSIPRESDDPKFNLTMSKAQSSVQKIDIDHQILSNYINSCAGYSVMTYFLGIGDRHLENIMINDKGRFFHIDFGFILGEDPKLYPPPFKLSSQLVEGMGGLNSDSYKLFKQKSVNAYLYLRKRAKLIINLFLLMMDSGIKDLSEAGLKKMYDKFLIDKNDQEAEKYFINVIEQSVKAYFAEAMDKFHEIAVKLRN